MAHVSRTSPSAVVLRVQIPSEREGLAVGVPEREGVAGLPLPLPFVEPVDEHEAPAGAGDVPRRGVVRDALDANIDLRFRAIREKEPPADQLEAMRRWNESDGLRRGDVVAGWKITGDVGELEEVPENIHGRNENGPAAHEESA